MIIKSIDGTILASTVHKTTRKTLEHCAARGIDLARADLRRAKLSGASLDGLKARGASFWGADLYGCDLGLADLRGADFRGADFKDCCLAESDLSGADMRGAYFSGTIFEGSILDSVKASCPSLWNCELQTVHSMKRLSYMHQGEVRVVIDGPPLVVRGLSHPLVILPRFCIWGTRLYPFGMLPRNVRQGLFAVKTLAEKALVGSMPNAKKPIPKIVSAKG